MIPPMILLNIAASKTWPTMKHHLITASSCGERESERLHNIASRLHEQLEHIIEVSLVFSIFETGIFSYAFCISGV